MKYQRGERFWGSTDNYVACDFTPEEWELLPERARKSLEENGYVDGKAPEHLKQKKHPRSPSQDDKVL